MFIPVSQVKEQRLKELKDLPKVTATKGRAEQAGSRACGLDPVARDCKELTPVAEAKKSLSFS